MTNKAIRITLLVLCMFPVKLWAGQLDSYFAGVKSIQANFTQKVVLGKTGEQITKGKLYVVSPDKFRLDYTEPYSQLYIADGKTLWSYDEDLEQVIIKPQGNLLANTPAWC